MIKDGMLLYSVTSWSKALPPAYHYVLAYLWVVALSMTFTFAPCQFYCRYRQICKLVPRLLCLNQSCPVSLAPLVGLADGICRRSQRPRQGRRQGPKKCVGPPFGNSTMSNFTPFYTPATNINILHSVNRVPPAGGPVSAIFGLVAQITFENSRFFARFRRSQRLIA